MSEQLPRYSPGDRVRFTTTGTKATVIEETWPGGTGVYFCEVPGRDAPVTMPAQLLEPDTEAPTP